MRRIVYRGWSSGAELDLGTHDGTGTTDAGLVMRGATSTRAYTDPHRDDRTRTYEQATWTSPVVSADFPVTELIASWNARTPTGCWLEVEVAATLDDGSRTPWFVLGRWAETDEEILSTTVPAQGDERAEVAFDIVVAKTPRTLASYRLRVNLLRRPGLGDGPTVSHVGAMASNVPTGQPVPRSAGGGAEGIVLDVPAYSQQVHRGEYPQWDSGGESWCSPTSTTMVLGHWGRGPSPEDYAWVDAGLQDRVIDHAARHTFDYNYKGAGNWSFNTAYAARFGVRAYVTRLRSLTEVEQFIKAGIPLVVSVSFKQDELEGAGYDTAGHLLTVIGFDQDGNVVSNDPASHGLPSNDEVRTTYDREQFENAWMIPTGGIVYVIHPPDVPLPEPPAEPNWLFTRR
ncbi:MAG TPA: C39 family peptidase [Nocardioidaceae bacterium]|nr:C39 family peptidase [Nocardioidaceae bacterium]